MQRSLRAHTFSSPACVHAIESSDDDSHRPAMASTVEDEPRKKVIISNKVTKLLLPLKYRQRISQAFRSLSRGANKSGKDDDAPAAAAAASDREESDVETFVSATSTELRSSCTDDSDDYSEPPSFRLSPPPPIFPTGNIGRAAPASPVKIVHKLPFGFVIGRQLDAPRPPPSPLTLARSIKKVIPAVAALHLRSRSHMVKKKVIRALKETFRRGRRGGAEGGGGSGDGGDADEDVFWKKDLRGLRCRQVEEDGPY